MTDPALDPTPPDDGTYPEQTVADMIGVPAQDVPDIALPDSDPDEDDPEDVIA